MAAALDEFGAGTITAVDLSHWAVAVVLYDANGAIVGLVQAEGDTLLAGEPLEFTTAPTSAAATRWETFPSATLTPELP